MEAMLVSLRLGAKIPKSSLAAALRHCIVAAFIRSFTTMIPCRPTLLAWPSSHRRALGLANYEGTAFATCNQPTVSASNAGGLFLPAILECIASNALSHLGLGWHEGRVARLGRVALGDQPAGGAGRRRTKEAHTRRADAHPTQRRAQEHRQLDALLALAAAPKLLPSAACRHTGGLEATQRHSGWRL